MNFLKEERNEHILRIVQFQKFIYDTIVIIPFQREMQ